MRKTSSLALYIMMVLTTVFGTAAHAQEWRRIFGESIKPAPQTQRLVPEEFGGLDSWTVIPLTRFVPENDRVAYTTAGSLYWSLRDPAQTGSFFAPLDLPPGIEVAEVCTFVKDSDPAQDIYVALSWSEMGDAVDGPNFGYVPGSIAHTGVAETPGYVQLCSPLSPPLLVRGFTDADGDGHSAWVSYNLVVSPSYSTSFEIQWGGALVKWRRVVSPAPTSASFNDVPPNHPLFKWVEALKASGISGGCTANTFCPDSPVTRGQMAVFLATALGLHWAF